MLKGDVNIILGNLKDAEACYYQAVSIAEEGNFEENMKVEAFICLQSAIYSQGKNDEALANLTPLLSNPKLTPRNFAFLKHTLGNIYRSAANWHLAEKLLSEAIELAKELNDTIHEMEWTGELGRVYRSSGLHHEAIKRQKEAYKAALKRGDIARLAASCGYIGFTMYSLPTPNYSEAIKYLGTRLLLAEEKLGDRSSVRWCLNNIGKVYLGLKTIEPAIECFQRSLEDAKRMGSFLGEGTALGNLGSALREAGKHHKAIECHKSYLENARKRLDTGGEAIMLYELAVDHLLVKDLQLATEYALNGVSTLNRIRSRLTDKDDQLKIGNFEKNQAKLYNLLQQLLVKQEEYHSALLISELGRARALSDLVQAKLNVKSRFVELLSCFVDSNAHIDHSAVDDAFTLLHSLCSAVKSTLVIYSMVTEISEENLQSTWVYIWGLSSNKSFHFAKRQICSQSVSFQMDDDFFNNLRRDIGVRGIKLVNKQKYPAPSQTETHVSKKEESSEVSKPSHSSPSKLQGKLRALYDCLLSPIRAHLPHFDGNLAAPHLILIPHDVIYNVPFAALHDGNRYLIEQYTLSQAPCLSVLHLLVERQRLCHEHRSVALITDALIIADPKMPHKDIPQLPGANQEASSIHKIIGGNVFTKEEATKQTVISNLSSSSIIHFATHATIFDSIAEHLETDEHQDTLATAVGDYSIKGAIVLASSSSSCSGILTSQEIQTMNLKCELMTLSCCRTACGKVTGDGVLGLSRAVLVAGAQSFIVTLWPIEDNSTTVLMKVFYEHYKVDRNAPRAMRTAVLHLLRENLDVEYWGAFDVSGVSPGML